MSEINPACPSCDVPYTQHPGLIATCRKLQEADLRMHKLIGELIGALNAAYGDYPGVWPESAKRALRGDVG